MKLPWLHTASRFVVDELGSDLIVTGLYRHELPRLPEVVVRETIANAVAHRTYELDRAAVLVEIRPDVVVNRSLGPKDRLLLVHAARGESLTNGSARSILGTEDRVLAREALHRLRDAGLLEQHGERGGAAYALTDTVAPPAAFRLSRENWAKWSLRRPRRSRCQTPVSGRSQAWTDRPPSACCSRWFGREGSARTASGAVRRTSL